MRRDVFQAIADLLESYLKELQLKIKTIAEKNELFTMVVKERHAIEGGNQTIDRLEQELIKM